MVQGRFVYTLVKRTFLYNEKAYSIKGELLKELNNQFYISEEYMLKILIFLFESKTMNFN